jgi:hypothetical protein
VSGTLRAEALWPDAYGGDVNAYLSRFGHLFVTATETVDVHGRQVAIGVCFRAAFELAPPRWNLTLSDGFGLEVHEPTIPAERLTWSHSIYEISKRGIISKPIGLIVDAIPRALDRLNAKSEPIRDGLYLPEGFELVYGCRGSETELAVNAALAFCRNEINGVANQLRRGDVPELSETVESPLFSRIRKFEFNMPKSGEGHSAA